jgi:hypothetical protein
MKNFYSILKIIDFSKVSYGFHIDGNKNYRTTLGGSIYLIMIVFLLYFIVNSFMDFFSRNIYNEVTVNKILYSPPEINLNKHMLKFGFFIENESNKPLPQDLIDRYFVLNLTYTNKTESKENITNINILKYTEKNFLYPYNKDNNFIKYKKYLNYYCMDNSNYTIKGSYNDEIFSYLSIKLYLNWTTVIQESIDSKNSFL